MQDLTNLPPPPKGQTGITLDQFNHLPPPPKGQVGVTLDQIQSQQPAKQSFFDPMKAQAEAMKQEGINNPSTLKGALQYGAGAMGSIGAGVAEFVGADKPIANVGQKIAKAVLPQGLPQNYDPVTGRQAIAGAAETALTLGTGGGTSILKAGLKTGL